MWRCSTRLTPQLPQRSSLRCGRTLLPVSTLMSCTATAHLPHTRCKENNCKRKLLTEYTKKEQKRRARTHTHTNTHTRTHTFILHPYTNIVMNIIDCSVCTTQSSGSKMRHSLHNCQQAFWLTHSASLSLDVDVAPATFAVNGTVFIALGTKYNIPARSATSASQAYSENV